MYLIEDTLSATECGKQGPKQSHSTSGGNAHLKKMLKAKLRPLVRQPTAAMAAELQLRQTAAVLFKICRTKEAGQ